MRKVLSQKGSSFWLMLVGIIFSAILAGITAGISEKRYVFVLVLPFVFLIIFVIPQQLKLWFLAFSIPLSLLQIPTLPSYGFSLSELLLLVLTADEVIKIITGDSGKLLHPGILIFSGLFALGGLVTSMEAGNFTWWHKYCLMPFIWFFLSYRNIHCAKDVWLVVNFSLMTIIGYIFIIELSSATGQLESLPVTTLSWRFTDGFIVNFGPIVFVSYAIRTGSIIALGIPACILLRMEKKGDYWWRIGTFLLMTGFCIILFFTAARGAVVAAALGAFFVIFFSGRFRSRNLIALVTFLFIALLLWGRSLLSLLPDNNFQRLLTLFQNAWEDQNFQMRIDSLRFSWEITRQNPLGVGIAYSWNNYGIDNAIIYSYILEGTGLLGAIAFILLIGKLAFDYGKTVYLNSVNFARDFASIGVGTLIVGLVAGVSSQSTLFEPVHSFVFWAIIAATVQGMKNQV
jgi:hypothetical protein